MAEHPDHPLVPPPRGLPDEEPAQKSPGAAQGVTGHRDPVLAVHGSMTFGYRVALLLGAFADIGAFYQVMQLVMPQDEVVVFLVVLGLTAVVLFLGHITGMWLRDVKIRPAAPVKGPGKVSVRALWSWWSRRVPAFLCVLVWLAIGLVSCWIRLTVPTESGGMDFGSVGEVGASSEEYAIEAAGIFLTLYFGTGLAAALGAYLTHDPLRSAYAAAVRRHRRQTVRAARSARRRAVAQTEVNRYVAQLRAAQRIRDEEEQARRALAERLKQYSRVLLAQEAGDPAVTDAFFAPDRRPYDWASRPHDRTSTDNGASPSS